MKYIKLIIVFIFTFFLFEINTYASVNTYTRTKENPLVPKDVEVNDNNIKDILNTPAVSNTEKVYDYADLYTEEEEEKIYKKIDQYIENTDIDAVVVTTKDLNGFSISDYAYHFYDYNNFKDDGIIFVIYISGVEPQIFMGNSGNPTGKVFTIYTDTRINQTLKYVYKSIKTGDYHKAIDDYLRILEGFYNLDRDGNYRVDDEGNLVKELPWIGMIILSAAVTFIIVIVLIYQLKAHSKFLAKDVLSRKLDNNTLMVKTECDNLIDTSVSSEK